MIAEARRLDAASPQERIKRKRSTDWFDQLVVARWRQDNDRQQTQNES